jgi:hypothetical protein
MLSQGERTELISTSAILSYLRDLHLQLQGFLAAESVDAEVERLQSTLEYRRQRIIERSAAVHARLSVAYDTICRALPLVTSLLDHKLHRRSQHDRLMVEVLHQRAIAFDLKLKSMRSRLALETYRPGAVRALRCIRELLTKDVVRAQSDLDGARRRLDQYVGISEFDAVVTEYVGLRRHINRQKELIEQLAAGECR